MSLKEDAARWARENKNEFAQNIIELSGVKPTELPSAIFMAGLPGAGKTELAHGLMKMTSSKVVFLDMDELAQKIPNYRAECADEFRAGATILLERLFDKVITKKLDFILDGTFGNPKALANVKRAISHGYFVKILYVAQSPEVAWSFTKAREKVEHRAIDLDGFIKTYECVYDNLRHLEIDGDRISLDVAIKDKNNSIKEFYGGASGEIIDEVAPLKYNEESLKRLSRNDKW